MNSRALLPLLLLFTASATLVHAAQAPAETAVTRATLPNGMRVVIIRNSLAPVVTVEANFLVGGDETPAGFPGMAHAQEHMAFRGCTGMSADQTAAIYAQLGGENNADTEQNITQYYATVPAADLDIALQAQATCLRGIDDSDQEWNQERGAIEQEVARDLSNPTYKFVSRLDQDMFAGTPYAHDPLGTKTSLIRRTLIHPPRWGGKEMAATTGIKARGAAHEKVFARRTHMDRPEPFRASLDRCNSLRDVNTVRRSGMKGREQLPGLQRKCELNHSIDCN